MVRGETEARAYSERVERAKTAARRSDTREEQVARESDRALFKERAANEEQEARDARWERVERLTGHTIVVMTGSDNSWCSQDVIDAVTLAEQIVNEIDARRAREGGSK